MNKRVIANYTDYFLASTEEHEIDGEIFIELRRKGEAMTVHRPVVTDGKTYPYIEEKQERCRVVWDRESVSAYDRALNSWVNQEAIK